MSRITIPYAVADFVPLRKKGYYYDYNEKEKSSTFVRCNMDRCKSHRRTPPTHGATLRYFGKQRV